MIISFTIEVSSTLVGRVTNVVIAGDIDKPFCRAFAVVIVSCRAITVFNIFGRAFAVFNVVVRRYAVFNICWLHGSIFYIYFGACLILILLVAHVVATVCVARVGFQRFLSRVLGFNAF